MGLPSGRRLRAMMIGATAVRLWRRCYECSARRRVPMGRHARMEAAYFNGQLAHCFATPLEDVSDILLNLPCQCFQDSSRCLLNAD
jgi:hypothetical protein